MCARAQVDTGEGKGCVKGEFCNASRMRPFNGGGHGALTSCDSVHGAEANRGNNLSDGFFIDDVFIVSKKTAL